MTNKIVLLCGGFSDEKEISQKTSSAIASALIDNGYNVELVDPVDFITYSELISYIKSKKPVIVFNGLHGAEGEDGRIQAMLSLENLKFTGSKHTASAIAMNKYISTLIANSLDIPCPRQVLINHPEELTNDKIDFLKYPFIVKPNSNGSSVGVHIVNEEAQVHEALANAFMFDTQVLCQEFIPGRELTVSILGQQVLPVVEINPLDGFYDYQNKYTKGKTEYLCPSNFTEAEQIVAQKFAKDIFFACNCSVYGRVDFRFDGKKFYFLEINTLPGMTELSLTPMAARNAKISFNELIKKIIELSM